MRLAGSWIITSLRRVVTIHGPDSGRLKEACGFWPVRLASMSMRGRGPVAVQTLMFVFADVGGSALLVRPLRGAYAGDGGRLSLSAGPGGRGRA